MIWLTAIALVAYPLSFGPVYSVSFYHPDLFARFGWSVEIMYGPLITYACRHRYGYVDSFLYWYLTAVWRVPLVRR